MHCTKFLLDFDALQHNSCHVWDGQFGRNHFEARTLFNMHKTLRKLWMGDLAAQRAHLKRLDPEARRLRFGGVTSDEFIDAYVDTAFRLDATIFAVFIDGEIRGSAELRSIFGGATQDAEAAFAVEAGWQDRGLGSELMDRILTTAQNRGIGRLHMICLSENARMRHIAGKFGARLTFAEGEVSGEVSPPAPTPMSLLDEFVHDAQDFVTAAFDWRR
ncbi:MAG: GNAT family N-acetyltransferase [Alphaproteobacteria bacterium]|nr:MAG: GNAT family N-acetyltransferase [Alphaproteobacteria bacterium]TMJ42592.1 MAG: GNAT family N-acetyltransferase [Alphaproteobacteria bacterium]